MSFYTLGLNKLLLTLQICELHNSPKMHFLLNWKIYMMWPRSCVLGFYPCCFCQNVDYLHLHLFTILILAVQTSGRYYPSKPDLRHLSSWMPALVPMCSAGLLPLDGGLASAVTFQRNFCILQKQTYPKRERCVYHYFWMTATKKT